jgi:hypothetical protein
LFDFHIAELITAPQIRVLGKSPLASIDQAYPKRSTTDTRPRKICFSILSLEQPVLAEVNLYERQSKRGIALSDHTVEKESWWTSFPLGTTLAFGLPTNTHKDSRDTCENVPAMG